MIKVTVKNKVLGEPNILKCDIVLVEDNEIKFYKNNLIFAKKNFSVDEILKIERSNDE